MQAYCDGREEKIRENGKFKSYKTNWFVHDIANIIYIYIYRNAEKKDI